MGLEALLARLEGRVVTSMTADVTPAVTAKPAFHKACTSVTSDNTEGTLPIEAAEPKEALFTPTEADYVDAQEALAEAVAERSAILEHCAGLPRAEAEQG